MFGIFRDDSLFSEASELLREIDRTKGQLDAARNHFDEAVDPAMIDCHIYEWNAAQLRYQVLLRKFKNQEPAV